jgi:hypothetical protein
VSIRNLALGFSGSATLIAIVWLFLDVSSAPAQPAQSKIDDAKKKHERIAQVPSATSMPTDPWAHAADQHEPKVGVPIPPRVAPTPPAEADVEPTPPPTVTPAEAATPDVDNDPRLATTSAEDEANRDYDKQDYEGAMTKALEVLKATPGDVRMVRVVVSSACQLGDADKAKQYWAQLPPHDQDQMQRRCQRFGITFTAQ